MNLTLMMGTYCVLATLQNVCIVGYYGFYIFRKNLKHQWIFDEK